MMSVAGPGMVAVVLISLGRNGQRPKVATPKPSRRAFDVDLVAFFIIHASLFHNVAFLQFLKKFNPAEASAAASCFQTANPPCPLPSAVSHVEASRLLVPHGHACLPDDP